MTFSITPDAFTTEAEAHAEVQREGWFWHIAQVPPEDNEPHYHPFDSTVYVLEGSMDFIEVETGIQHRCGPGTRVKDWGDNVHHEHHNGYRALVGFQQDPAEIFKNPAMVKV